MSEECPYCDEFRSDCNKLLEDKAKLEGELAKAEARKLGAIRAHTEVEEILARVQALRDQRISPEQPWKLCAGCAAELDKALKGATPARDLLFELSDALTEAVDHKELVQWLKKEVTKIEDNDVYKQPAAIIQINAPVALIQVELSSRRRALMEVLEKL